METVRIETVPDFTGLIRSAGVSLRTEIEPLVEWLHAHGRISELVPFVPRKTAADIVAPEPEDVPALVAALPFECDVRETVAICPISTHTGNSIMNDGLACAYYEAHVVDAAVSRYKLVSRVLSFHPEAPPYWFGLSAIHAVALGCSSPAHEAMTPEEFQADLGRLHRKMNEAYMLVARVINAQVGGHLFGIMEMIRSLGVKACVDFLEREIARDLPDGGDGVLRRSLLGHIAQTFIDPSKNQLTIARLKGR